MSMEEDAWREALRIKGRDWVLAELRMRPGLPEDPLHEVVYTPPFPTREFCRRWCVEIDTQYGRLSGSTIGLIVGVAILGIFIAMAMYSWSNVAPTSPPTAQTQGVTTQTHGVQE